MTSIHRPNLSLADMDRNAFFHPMTDLKRYAQGEAAGPRIIAGAKGVHIVDRDGRRYLDGFGGLYCVNVGYGRSEVAEAIAAQARQLAYYHVYAGNSNEPSIRLADRLIRLAPQGMSKVYFGLSGSDANETSAKIVWYYNNVLGRPAKKKIIARRRAYHGATVLAGSLTGIEVFHKAFDLPIERVLRTTAPHHYWEAAPGISESAFSAKCAEDLEELIQREGPETIAAFIGEPMLGSGGIVPPPEGYWQAIQAVLAKHDILLIADEVVCGFGRLGSDFGSLHYGLKPDIMTCAKGLTSAYAPLSATIVGERVWQVLEQGSDAFGPFAHGYTYAGHPIGAAAALANLDIIEQENLAENARRVGQRILGRLHGALDGHPLVGEVRGEGLLFAIEVVADKAKRQRFDPTLKIGARLAGLCLEKGLIGRAMPGGDILGFAPPLVISEGEADELVDSTLRSIDELAAALTKEGSWKAAA
ncbi:MAG TPA: aminotransferase [Kiloniellales bacterium]|nr:aminotransferase [Kiloniellales bacterium]